jgi:hypothetical protein
MHTKLVCILGRCGMASSQADRPASDLRAVLDGIRQWVDRHLEDTTPAQVTEVLAVSAFLVGLNMAWANPAQAAGLLRETAEQVPSVGDYTRTLADDLARVGEGAARDIRSERKGAFSVEPVALATLPPFLLN